MIKKELSATLMVANLLATFCVIAIHYSSINIIDTQTGYSSNYLFQQFIANGVAAIAVPFFAMISGFFMTGKVDDMQQYRANLVKKSRTLLLPYLLASTLLLAVLLLHNYIGHKDINAYLNPVYLLESIFAQPVSVQFWFLRDLIVLTLLAPLFLTQNSIYSSVLGALLISLWLLNIQPMPIIADWYLISIETMFFFWLGGVVRRHQPVLDVLMTLNLRFKLALFFTWLFLIVLRIYIEPSFSTWYTENHNIIATLIYKIAILLGIISLIQFSSWSAMRDNQRIIYLSGLTFFAYLFHLFPLAWVIQKFTVHFIHTSYTFYVDFPLATIIVFFLAHVTSRYAGNVYALFTGGRTPGKVMKRIV